MSNKTPKKKTPKSPEEVSLIEEDTLSIPTNAAGDYSSINKDPILEGGAINDDDILISTESGEGTQLQQGEMAYPWTWKYFGVYYQYVCVGFFYGSMNPLMYPIFKNVLNMKSYTVKGGLQVMTVWWTLKMFIGSVSDCFPIMGYRRKVYVVFGWIGAILMTLVVIFLGQPHPGDAAWPYLLGFSAVNFFYIIADVAMDGRVTDLAQREPVDKRGTLQSDIYFVRFICMSIAGGLMAFGFSGERYGGTFAWSFDLPHYLIILVIIAVLGIYPFIRVEEENTNERKPFFAQYGQLFQRIQLTAVWRVILFSFLIHLVTSINNAAAYDIEKQWCGAKPWVDGLFSSVLSNLILAGAIFATKKWFLNTSWHVLLVISCLFMAITTYVPAILIDFAVIRSQFFYVGAPLVTQLAAGMFFIVSSYCCVEVAEPGYEAITYGMMTTIGNLTIPFTSVISANLASLFNLYDEDGNLDDSSAGRKRMFYLDTVIFLIQMTAIPITFIIPKQKHAIQELLKANTSSFGVGLTLVIILTFCLLWALTGNFLQIFESTACLKIVGGDGC